VVGTFGPVVVGDALDDGAPGCARNDFFGDVVFDANQFVELGGNRVSGSVSLTSTAGPAPSAEDSAPEVEANQITANLSCANNTPAPTNDGKPNTVLGTRSGQCSGL
jgi:hypothetical protein